MESLFVEHLEVGDKFRFVPSRDCREYVVLGFLDSTGTVRISEVLHGKHLAETKCYYGSEVKRVP